VLRVADRLAVIGVDVLAARLRRGGRGAGL
jgi:hypothetical protein